MINTLLAMLHSGAVDSVWKLVKDATLTVHHNSQKKQKAKHSRLASGSLCICHWISVVWVDLLQTAASTSLEYVQLLHFDKRWQPFRGNLWGSSIANTNCIEQGAISKEHVGNITLNHYNLWRCYNIHSINRSRMDNGSLFLLLWMTVHCIRCKMMYIHKHNITQLCIVQVHNTYYIIYSIQYIYIYIYIQKSYNLYNSWECYTII